MPDGEDVDRLPVVVETGLGLQDVEAPQVVGGEGLPQEEGVGEVLTGLSVGHEGERRCRAEQTRPPVPQT